MKKLILLNNILKPENDTAETIFLQEKIGISEAGDGN